MISRICAGLEQIEQIPFITPTVGFSLFTKSQKHSAFFSTVKDGRGEYLGTWPPRPLCRKLYKKTAPSGAAARSVANFSTTRISFLLRSQSRRK